MNDNGLIKLTVYVTPDMKQYLENLADRDGRSLTKQVSRVLADYIKRSKAAATRSKNHERLLQR